MRRPTNNIGYLINHLAFVLGRQSDYALQQALGIGFSQFKIMMVLKWNPSVQQKQIADSLGQTEASISRQIKLLHDKGYLTTRISAENRREHITTLTEKGEAATTTAMQTLNEYHAPVFAAFSEAQREQLKQLLTTMHAEVCRDRKPGACDHPLGI